MAELIEQRHRLRREELPADTVVVVRGGRDSIDKIRKHTWRTARAWSLDGMPLLGISVFAVLDPPLDRLLAARFSSFRTVYLCTVGQLRSAGFELLATGRRPHFTIRLSAASDEELNALLAVLGPARDNPEYGNTSVPREED